MASARPVVGLNIFPAIKGSCCIDCAKCILSPRNGTPAPNFLCKKNDHALMETFLASDGKTCTD
jgi:hypothetical protein